MDQKAIRHVVQFRLKHAPDSAAAKAFLEEGRRALSSIPVVKFFEVLRQVSGKNSFDFAFSMEFLQQEDYEAYDRHPVHVRFVEEHWKKEVEAFLETDLQIWKG
ncbi:Dabb family protein [Paenibacillus sp. YN15]|uniref:Dabb family protein n=1 Tax=Paenibacillus sp. YN15 TaxID=1742774 RepID=UPI000DCB7151|nr:Dabb family protein [Paenibacillus sp. YN15]RAV04649.1 Dabb family protein [Paenibacillus sp. YN15]